MVLAIYSFSACSKDTGEKEPEIIILQPTKVSLSFPANNEPCLETTQVNDNQSSITFRWTPGQNVSSYDLTLINLTTNNSVDYNTTTNDKVVTLEHEEPYSWKVTSNGQSGSQPAESDTWKFYLAGPSQVNYAPFPAELTSPISGSTVTPSDGVIPIQWTCTDVDNDLTQFNVYLDTIDGSTLIQTIDFESNTTSIDVTVENNLTYFWKVIAIDAKGYESDSGVYSFRTN